MLSQKYSQRKHDVNIEEKVSIRTLYFTPVESDVGYF